MRSSQLAWLCACCALLLTSLSAQADNRFPLRGEYPDVATIDAAQLQQQLARTTLVDVRSRFEHDTILINNSHWAPVSVRQFDSELQKITRGNQKVELVFYCNGQACNKSYQAARHAQAIGYQKVRAFDAGILAWAEQYPEHTTLLGKTPADTSQLLAQQRYREFLLPAAQFKQQCIGPNRVVFDIRDPVQRKNKRFLDGVAQRYPLDLLIKLLDTPEFRKKHRNKTFCFFDESQRQVPWLKLYLDSHNYSNYQFLKGGALSL